MIPIISFLYGFIGMFVCAYFEKRRDMDMFLIARFSRWLVWPLGLIRVSYDALVDHMYSRSNRHLHKQLTINKDTYAVYAESLFIRIEILEAEIVLLKKTVVHERARGDYYKESYLNNRD